MVKYKYINYIMKGPETMKYIRTNWSIPAYNMAMEDFIINELPMDDYVTFYIHDPSIIIGQHQNTIEEINQEYVEEKGIHVQRRLSGGGAVYHDHGNLNFSFIVKGSVENVNDFDVLTRPVIKTLEKMGIKSELSGRNDILIDGKKFSGNAQYFAKGKLLQHGTILFNSEMSELGKALKVKELKIESKGIKSVRSRVTNIMDYLEDKSFTIEQFKELLLKTIGEIYPLEEYVLSEAELKRIQELVDTKFSTWEWNYGKSPRFNITKTQKFPFGIIDARINVEKGMISEIRLFGDFFVRREIGTLEKALTGIRYDRESILKALEAVDVSDYFNNMTKEELSDFLS